VTGIILGLQRGESDGNRGRGALHNPSKASLGIGDVKGFVSLSLAPVELLLLPCKQSGLAL